MSSPEDRRRSTTPGAEPEPEPAPETGAVPPPPPPPAPEADTGSAAEPERKAEPERESRRDRSDLTRDLDEVQRGRPERAFNVGAVVGIVLTVAAAIFVIQNNQTTEFDWLWFDFELPLWTALLGAVGVGIVLIVVLFAVHDRRQRRIGRRRDAAGRLRRELSPREPKAAG